MSPTTAVLRSRCPPNLLVVPDRTERFGSSQVWHWGLIEFPFSRTRHFSTGTTMYYAELTPCHHCAFAVHYPPSALVPLPRSRRDLRCDKCMLSDALHCLVVNMDHANSSRLESVLSQFPQFVARVVTAIRASQQVTTSCHIKLCHPRNRIRLSFDQEGEVLYIHLHARDWEPTAWQSV